MPKRKPTLEQIVDLLRLMAWYAIQCCGVVVAFTLLWLVARSCYALIRYGETHWF